MTKREVFKIDNNGYITNVFHAIFDKDNVCLDDLSEGVITTQPQSLYRARWSGVEWVEDMSQEEIDELNTQAHTQTELDSLMLAIAELDIQREIDKTETQMAIAELANTMLGGM